MDLQYFQWFIILLATHSLACIVGAFARPITPHSKLWRQFALHQLSDEANEYQINVFKHFMARLQTLDFNTKCLLVPLATLAVALYVNWQLSLIATGCFAVVWVTLWVVTRWLQAVSVAQVNHAMAPSESLLLTLNVDVQLLFGLRERAVQEYKNRLQPATHRQCRSVPALSYKLNSERCSR